MRCYNHYSFSICDLFPLINRRDLKQRVIALIENGFSASDTGRRCHVPLRTAQRWAHKFQNYGEFQRRYSTGCPHCSTREEDEAFLTIHEENLFCPVNQIRAAANFPGTSQWLWTIWEMQICIAVQRGLNRGTSCRPPSLCNQLGRDFDWGNITFTDKTSISSYCESHGHV